MEYFTKIKAALEFIEKRAKDNLSDVEVADAVCFSQSHFRTVFRAAIGQGLSGYIRQRRLYHAALRLKRTNDTVLDIAVDYGFGSHESFTRAFYRLFGCTPSQFRSENRRIDMGIITPGIFGPVLVKEEQQMSDSVKDQVKGQDFALLRGVPQVSYFTKACELTPFPSSLRSCLKYMDHDFPYDHLMCTSGAAFRMIWNTTMWDGGNVDITYIREDTCEPLRRACHAVGIEVNMLAREDSKAKYWKDLTEGVREGDREAFLEMIKHEIDEGRPLIAFGIIGPPEACVITGYRKHGEELTGWNFFQGMPEWAGSIETTEEGYFIKSDWYENPETRGVLALNKSRAEPDPIDLLKATLNYAVEIMLPRKVRDCAGGLTAFDAWAEKLTDAEEFQEGMPMAQLFERIMCHTDACTMVGEGRWNAHTWTKRMAALCPPAAEPLCKVSSIFKESHDLVWQMWSLIGGVGVGEKQARNLAKEEVRQKSRKLIEKARSFDERAIEYLKQAGSLI